MRISDWSSDVCSSDLSGNILAFPGNGQGEVWRYVSLRSPQIIAFVLPFSVLLGTIVTLATMNQNSEVIALKGAGLSAHQVLAPLILAGLAVSMISFAFNDRIVARARDRKSTRLNFQSLMRTSYAVF